MIALYCRQSVDKKDSISIEQQESACISLCKDESYTVFSDKGYTGANINRPGFENMMREIKKGKITKVIVYKVDRISRSLQDFVRIYGDFEKYSVEFVSSCEQFDTSTAMGKATLQIIMVFAELERSMIQKRVTDNFYERGKKGLFLAGTAPYGFCRAETVIGGIRTHKLEPDRDAPKKLEAVKRMFKSYRINKSLSLTARELNKEGMFTNRGKAFTSVSVSRILRNTVYVRADAEVYRYLKSKGAIIDRSVEDFTGVYGCTVYGSRKGKTKKKFTDLSGEYVQLNLHEGIIPAGEWLAVQYELDKNKPVSNSGKGRNTWLTGLTSCGFCGRGISVVNGQRSGKRYMNCGGKKEHICRGRKAHMTFDDLENAVSEGLLNYIKEFEFSDIVKDNTAFPEENTLKIKYTKNSEEIRELVSKVGSANEALMRYINERIEILDKENKMLENRLSELKNKTRRCSDGFDIKKKLIDFRAMPFEQKKAIARVFIEKIIVGDGEAKVFYR